MQISQFADLLQAARQQKEPQRLFFIFAAAELPEDATPVQRERYASGGGGALTPVMAVDKSPKDLPSFEVLVEESKLTGTHWDMVFVTTQSIPDGLLPDATQVEQTLIQLIERIRMGNVDSFLTFDRSGQLTRLS